MGMPPPILVGPPNSGPKSASSLNQRYSKRHADFGEDAYPSPNMNCVPVPWSLLFEKSEGRNKFETSPKHVEFERDVARMAPAEPRSESPLSVLVGELRIRFGPQPANAEVETSLISGPRLVGAGRAEARQR
jgi:hypothetical protein